MADKNDQLDLFGSTSADLFSEEVAPPVLSASGWQMAETAAVVSALHRGSLVDTLAILNRLKVDVAWRVLLEAGFTVGSTQSRAEMMAPVQMDIIEAAQRHMSGHELREARNAEAERERVESAEKEQENGRSTVQPGVIPGQYGVGNREDGPSGSVSRQSVDVGVAGTSQGTLSSGQLFAGAGEPSGSGKDGNGGGTELASLSTPGDSGDVRVAGGAAVGDGSDLQGRLEALRAGDNPADEVSGDYVLTDEDRIGLGGLSEKFRDNLAAIDVLKSLAKSGREASPEERRTLARYVGWGGLKGVFDPENKQWARQHRALKAVLTEKEWAAASRSQLDAFYTPPVVGKAIYSAVKQLGFKHGRVLEPSVGVGNFFGLMPPEMREGSVLHGVELDLLTSEIVAALYPSAKIAKATGFQNFRVPAGYFDMVTGNPPFGSQPLTDSTNSVYSGWSIHNYFFAKSIEMLRPGGIMPMVVSHSFLDKLDPHVRQWISRRAELVSGVRLPNTAFKENANTEVVTDVLIFRRLDEAASLGRESVPDWLNTSEVEVLNEKTGEMAKVTVNDYFVNNPGNVLGTTAVESSQFRANEYTVRPAGDLEAQLAAWVETLPEGVYVPLERSATELEQALISDVPEGVKEGSFFVRQGNVYQRLPDALHIFANHRVIDVVRVAVQLANDAVPQAPLLAAGQVAAVPQGRQSTLGLHSDRNRCANRYQNRSSQHLTHLR